ncbi:MAG: AMP-binding protein [Cyanobacteria bacterium P01_C01_bin.89]
MAITVSHQLVSQEQENFQRLVDYTDLAGLPEIWTRAAKNFGNLTALCDRHSKPNVELTFQELGALLQQFAAGLQSLIPDDAWQPTTEAGLTIPPRAALIADNCARWFVADQGMMTAGLANAVRSAQAETEELRYIIQHSGSRLVILEHTKLLRRLGSPLAELHQSQPFDAIVILTGELATDGSDRPATLPESVPLLTYEDVLERGKTAPFKAPTFTYDTLATLIYTSGTTGKPKGVMLSHGNLMHQMTSLGSVAAPYPGDPALTILPTWHSFGRAGDYYLASQGCKLVYTNLRSIKADFKTHQPFYMLAVPRLWESIYEGVQKQLRSQPAKKQNLVKTFLGFSEKHILAKRKAQGLELSTQPASGLMRFWSSIKAAAFWPLHKLGDRLIYKTIRQATGGKFRYAISGGGALAPHLELFFEIVDIKVLVGYGLTETAPVLTARRLWFNRRGSSGAPIPRTELQVVDLDSRQPLPIGDRGLVLARGPQVMGGYYQNPTATQKAINPDGWFDTGDIGQLFPNGDLIITGRAKDTIVLTNGENIEPQPIEDACARSVFVDQIMLVGQDQKVLGALIVPNREAVEINLRAQGVPVPQWSTNGNGAIALDPGLETLFRNELNRELRNRPGYKAEERIGPFRLLADGFSQENGQLTQTLKIRRPRVTDHYRDMIDGMFGAS